MNGYTLRELEAEFIVPIERGWKRVETLAEARGVSFLCPRCFKANNGAAGTHLVICWFVGVPQAPDRVGPGRWRPEGTSLADLTFGGPPPYSVKLSGGCNWHGYVRGGIGTLS